ncbi:MAG: hypothetical protein K5770_10145 [Lachnospiraceae bacterium]|nr:hypothetical protein [Lachnospiraceae bacterium]
MKIFNKVKAALLMLTAVLAGSLLSGCNSDEAIILADENEDAQLELVAEYAAGLLLKYDKSHANGLTVAVPQQPVMEDPVDISPPTPAEIEEMSEGGLDPTVNVSNDGPQGSTQEQGNTEEEETPVVSESGGSIADALGIPGFDVTYTGYEAVDVYPEDSSNEDVVLFSLTAEEGQKLLILHFDLSNFSGEDAECAPINKEAKIRLIINETDRLNQQMTILMNDLKSFDDILAAGETRDTVLVFYLDEDMQDSIESMSLLIIDTEGEHRFEL